MIENERMHRFLEGVAAGVVGLIVVTAVQLGWNLGRSVPSLAAGATIFAAGLALLYLWRAKFSVPMAILCSALAGLFLFR